MNMTNSNIKQEFSQPYYVPVKNEKQIFTAAYNRGLSILLKGPTGCGKTRFVEAMANELGRPLITVSCHDDLTTADLVVRAENNVIHGNMSVLSIYYAQTKTFSNFQ